MIPPPPPMTQNQYQNQNMQRDEQPLVSATFVPVGGSFGPGVGIPALDEFDYNGYDPAAYAQPQMNAPPPPTNATQSQMSHVYTPYSSKPSSAIADAVTRDHRAGSAGLSNKPTFLPLGSQDPISPGPPTAKLVDPSPTGRQRAQSALSTSSIAPDVANQWPLERVLLWMATNNYSQEWQKTIESLRIEKAEFLDLGRGVRGSGRMHRDIIPQLVKICSITRVDPVREKDDGRRLRKQISNILAQVESASSAGSGHRRQDSNLRSASTEGTVENSPHLGSTATPSTAGPEESPKFPQPGLTFNERAHARHNERSFTAPYTKANPGIPTPAEPKHAESFGPPPTRHDHPRGVFNGLHGRGRHSPNHSGDSGPRHEGSPGQSPALGHALPSQVLSSSHAALQSQQPKAVSVDSFAKATGYPRNLAVNNEFSIPSPRFYADRREERPEAYRTYSNEVQPTNKEHKRNFFTGLISRRKHDAESAIEEIPSPREPTFKSMTPNLPYARPALASSDAAIATRSHSAGVVERADLPFRRSANAPKRFVMVTNDYWNYRLVDVTDCDSALAFRKQICAGLDCNDVTQIQLYITEPGRQNHNEALSDGVLASIRNNTDATGNLKLFITTPELPAAATDASDSIRAPAFRVRPDYSNMSEEELLKAAEAYRAEADKKRREYLRSRQARMNNGDTAFDFSAKASPSFEHDPGTSTFVPRRPPPSAPQVSQMLTKVNSLRDPDRRSRASLDNSKRVSGGSLEGSGTVRPPSRDLDSTRDMDAAGFYRGATAPTTGSQRSYVIDGIVNRPRPNRGPVQQNLADSPQQVRTENNPTRRPISKFGEASQFTETNVKFSTSTIDRAVQKGSVQDDEEDEEEDDSDEGLFAAPLANRSDPKKGEQRPNLTIKTDHQRGVRPTVAFKSPGSASLTSAATTNTADSSVDLSDRGNDPRSFPGDTASWDSGPGSPEERRKRPDSFHSDIWASRPAIENVVDDLDKFFPGVDLDRPYLEEGGDASPATIADANSIDKFSSQLDSSLNFGTDGLALGFTKKGDTDTLGSDESTLKASNKDRLMDLPERQMRKSGGLGRMKSIREVATKRNHDLVRGSSIYQAQAANPPAETNKSTLLRRKSTKMFGAHIVQIKPQRGSRLSVLDPIPQEDIPTDETPKRQATFKIIRGQLIGKGTFGRVYLGMNATTGEFLAVKQVEVNQKAAAHDKDKIKEMVQALDHEIDTMQHLEHANIVQYLGCERKEYSISIYLEYIPGGSVGSCLRKHGKFEESVVRSLTQQTLSGLQYLHQESILHRDLKADNILLDLDGTCKISDFGISKKSDDVYGNDITNSMQGSVFWMAPEVIRSNGQGYSAKVDIWSLGCVVLEMFAGKRPWSREEAVGAMFKLGNLQQAPPIPDDVQATASVDGLNFMYDCFQVDPNDRPTAKTLLLLSSFCVPDKGYNFYNTDLAAKLRNSNMGSNNA